MVTNREDYTTDFVVMQLRKRGLSFVRFNTEDFPFEAAATFGSSRNWIRLAKSGTKLDFSTVKSVWYRRPSNPSFPADFDSAKDFVSHESRSFLQGIWRSLDCFWVNHPDKNRLAENKMEQLRRMARMGFRIPDTIVTNDPDEAKDFYQSHEGKIIAKTLRQSHGRLEKEEFVIYTNPVAEEQFRILDTVRLAPVIFQERLEKLSDIRVNVIGSDIYATEIHSQENSKTMIDWRRDTLALRHTVIDLPHDVEEQCLRLVQSYGLVFGAIDLVRTNSGYVFLELNPNGQWAWIEALTGQLISKRLIEALNDGRIE